ncbi:MAG: hypothetical protein B6226_03280 [Candidatus Cloacimonetes bacterium 4572_65]|nr:MAG: hypothetical protein B6226_03280 [Candidatus Cloacimonetes bacterium 4572_65]
MSDRLLSEEELEICKERLLKERKKSTDYLQKMNESQKSSVRDSSGDASAYAIHQADHGSDTYFRENQVLLMEKEHMRLKRINLALKRIYEKTYGICEICGKRISEPRLKVIPYAVFCIECRSAEDISKRKRR